MRKKNEDLNLQPIGYSVLELQITALNLLTRCVGNLSVMLLIGLPY